MVFSSVFAALGVTLGLGAVWRNYLTGKYLSYSFVAVMLIIAWTVGFTLDAMDMKLNDATMGLGLTAAAFLPTCVTAEIILLLRKMALKPKS